ncbi:hypothetical protein ABZV92_35855 [Streptomyces rubiginosohelvolus]|uniref:hypothetical protein n=1 Tax=Streptomyces rubiginosohelvolus TaxID=67362 RepID=UPI0033BDDD97
MTVPRPALVDLAEALVEEIDQMRQESAPGTSWSAEDERSAGLTLSDAAENLVQELRRQGLLTAPRPGLSPAERHLLRAFGPPVLGR